MHTNVLHLKKLQKIEPYSKKRFFLQNLLRVKQFLMQAVNGQLEHFRTANQNQVIRKYQKGPIRTCKSRNGQKRGKSMRPSWHSPITGRSETNSIQSPFTSISRWTLFYLTKRLRSKTMPLYTDPGSRTAHVWGHLSSYFRFKYFVSTEGKQLLQGTLKNMQGDHHTCTYLSKSISLAWKYLKISIKPLTSGLTPPTYTTPITAICLACEQALLFGFRLAAPFRALPPITSSAAA